MAPCKPTSKPTSKQLSKPTPSPPTAKLQVRTASGREWRPTEKENYRRKYQHIMFRSLTILFYSQ